MVRSRGLARRPEKSLPLALRPNSDLSASFHIVASGFGISNPIDWCLSFWPILPCPSLQD